MIDRVDRPVEQLVDEILVMDCQKRTEGTLSTIFRINLNSRRNKMDDERVKRIIEDTYDKSREDTIWTMVSDLYNRKTLSVIIVPCLMVQ